MALAWQSCEVSQVATGPAAQAFSVQATSPFSEQPQLLHWSTEGKLSPTW